MKIRSGVLALSLFLMVSTSHAKELRPETVKAWDQYVQRVNAQLQDRLNHEGHFLRVDNAPDRLASLLQGQILAAPVAANGREKVPHGLIHDWYGAVFVPGATITDVLAVLGDPDRYQEFYRPTVVDSKLLKRTQGDEKFSLLMLSKVLFVTVALDAQYESHLTCLDEKRCYIISYSVRTQQVKDYGRPSERTLPPDEGDGYLWRLYGITAFEKVDGGVVIENESVALSRDIPASVRWLVDPIVNHLPRNSMTTGLRQTREAVSSATAMESRGTVRRPTDNTTGIQLSVVHRSALR